MFNLILLLILQIHNASANTEKVIFLAPSSLQVPVQHPTLDDLQLHTLSPDRWSLRTHLEAAFPTDSSQYGQPTWVLLHGLQEGQRYEVRICWAATQPTSFRLNTYDLATVFKAPELITSLAQYSESRQLEIESAEHQRPKVSAAYKKSNKITDPVLSTLLLQIFAAADYFTMNQSLMEQVPPVFVDIILDPYILNVLPQSLLPTVAYVTILAIGSWRLSNYISSWMQSLSKDNDKKKNT